jgi:uncharacterized protein (TIGR02145 family)
MMLNNFKYYLALVVILLSTSILKAQSSNIQIVSDPGISVFLDALYKGKTNADMGGIVIDNVSVGSHTIKVLKEGFSPQEEKITVKPGEVFVYKVKPFVPKSTAEPKEQSATVEPIIKPEPKSVTTGPAEPDGTKGTITDPIDGYVYKTIVIGTQTWMAENLRATHFNDGTSIPKLIDVTSWNSLITPAYCRIFIKDTTHKYDYGLLYNWHTVNTGKLCPVGWHVPSDYEWSRLMTYCKTKVWKQKRNVTDILKEPGKTHWKQHMYVKSTATNESGFTALPGGALVKGLYTPGEIGFWWSSTEGSLNNAYDAWCRSIQYIDIDGNRENLSKAAGLSVRCLKD